MRAAGLEPATWGLKAIERVQQRFVGSLGLLGSLVRLPVALATRRALDDGDETYRSLRAPDSLGQVAFCFQ